MGKTGIRASAIIIKKDKILLIHRKKEDKEYWVFPGGGVEEGENPKETVKREVEEETSLKVKSVEFAFEDIHPWDKKSHPFYFVEVEDGKPVLGGEEAQKHSKDNWYHPEWVNLSDIPKANLVPESAKKRLVETWESQSKILYDSQEYNLTWIRANSLEGYSPIKQVSGICFDNNGQILIARSNPKSRWQLPGGHPEKDETVTQTLKRELLEEVDTKVKNIKILGVQKVEVPGQPGKTHYQVRCVCEIEKLLPQTVDPDNNNEWERKLVPAKKVTNYIKWSKLGRTIFSDALKLYQNISTEK